MTDIGHIVGIYAEMGIIFFQILILSGNLLLGIESQGCWQSREP
jgi:hypothetical protein